MRRRARWELTRPSDCYAVPRTAAEAAARLAPEAAVSTLREANGDNPLRYLPDRGRGRGGGCTAAEVAVEPEAASAAVEDF